MWSTSSKSYFTWATSLELLPWNYFNLTTSHELHLYFTCSTTLALFYFLWFTNYNTWSAEQPWNNLLLILDVIERPFQSQNYFSWATTLLYLHCSKKLGFPSLQVGVDLGYPARCGFLSLGFLTVPAWLAVAQPKSGRQVWACWVWAQKCFLDPKFFRT